MFACINIKANQHLYRFDIPILKPKSVFNHFIVQQRDKYVFIEKPGHVEAVIKLTKCSIK